MNGIHSDMSLVQITPNARVRLHGFDTHYPEYFPTRSNFKESLNYMQTKLGIWVAPYINGRIFDQGTVSWSA